MVCDFLQPIRSCSISDPKRMLNLVKVARFPLQHSTSLLKCMKLWLTFWTGSAKR